MKNKYLKSYKVVFRGKYRGKAGGVPDFRKVLAHNAQDAKRKVKRMFRGDIKIDRVVRSDKG